MFIPIWLLVILGTLALVGVLGITYVGCLSFMKGEYTHSKKGDRC